MFLASLTFKRNEKLKQTIFCVYVVSFVFNQEKKKINKISCFIFHLFSLLGSIHSFRRNVFVRFRLALNDIQLYNGTYTMCSQTHKHTRDFSDCGPIDEWIYVYLYTYTLEYLTHLPPS